MRTRHGDDLCLFCEEIVGPVVARLEQLKGATLLQLCEDLLDVSEATLRDLGVCSACIENV